MKGDERSEETHPSYGLLSVSRYCGGDGNLFGASVRHNHGGRGASIIFFLAAG
jgi:hypothetical protein